MYDSEVDGKRGTLTDWKLHVDVQPCRDELTWTKIHGPSCEKAIVVSDESGQAIHKCIIDKNGTSVPLSQTELSTPLPRYAHTAINVDDNVFVMGGFSERNLIDIWRYNYIENTWHLLKESQYPISTIAGRTAMIVPWGMIGFGGLYESNTGSKIAGLGIEKYNFSTSRWVNPQCATGEKSLFANLYEGCDRNIER